MTGKLTLNAAVMYGDVDRTEVLSLRGVFKFLQEAAIVHANQFDLGSRATATRGDTWVLNRMAVAILRYPKYEENVRVETWSRGIKGFKGYREFRAFDAAGAPVFSGSSLWLHVNIRTKSIARVPPELATSFPVHDEGVFCPELESLAFTAPPTDEARVLPVAVRYSDVDINEHVNNTAYLDYVQAALASAGLKPHPQRVQIKYAKSIPAAAETVNVRLLPRDAGAVFSIEEGESVFAVGEVA